MQNVSLKITHAPNLPPLARPGDEQTLILRFQNP